MAGASLFAVATPFDTDTTVEVRHGKTLVDAAAAAGIDHIVVSSATHSDRAFTTHMGTMLGEFGTTPDSADSRGRRPTRSGTVRLLGRPGG
ncbi:2Fe-2S iron-sulfur cluster-binding protein [Nocardia vermiculata]|uniref:NmrA family NAD(P)-binding protein n=1 Tax=Nocardia vermiculata TaxID=257274 RepID=A0A846XY52_9NOCA|nr:NmrA family NAD(P)-binding protein [Nocardia vermiculata]